VPAMLSFPQTHTAHGITRRRRRPHFVSRVFLTFLQIVLTLNTCIRLHLQAQFLTSDAYIIVFTLPLR
jgi:hypothetical protein